MSPAASESPTVPIAQAPPEGIPDRTPPENLVPRDLPPSEQPLPLPEPEPLPPLEELLEPTAPLEPLQPGGEPEAAPQTIFVERFEVVDSTVFNADVLAEVAKKAPQFMAEECSEIPNIQTIDGTDVLVNRELTFAELQQARTAITRVYICEGFITSGAIVPPQEPEDNVVRLQVIEGSLEDIEVLGTQRLNPGYVESRLALVTTPPLNQQRLLEGLQLLQLDPLIRRITAELQAGPRPSTNILEVTVAEADPFSVDFIANNNSSPSIGSFSRGVQLNHLNVWGLGDGLSMAYSNTDGSNEVDVSYVIPLNPRNGTLQLSYGNTNSWVIEPPFDILDIQSESSYYEATYRQPLYQSPTEEFALALTFSRQESQTRIGFADIGPFPISPGADENGRTEISAIRFTQEWFKRSGQQVLAARSQFSLGVDWFGATTNPVGPDGQFFAWRGQAQWVRLLREDTPLILRADVQLTPNPLLPLEQFGLGGQDTIRGYRQDALLTDSGVLASAEVRLPILQVADVQGILQLTPFIDIGAGWNVASKTPDPNVLAGTGLGLLWRQGNDLTVRLDWGIPLIANNTRRQTWQESGVYFSVVFNTF
ncbi:ShlB/FhaC/HecB family hemolysin secretion/activation protein [Nodosilinea sp. LEGE 07088]|uniref:ShlB/FhaC/HecB family hemolysin secretion/activation protein n=1 Tax=Nodosilinea sp. LEGE 07088 TaxID=2777968 RepID=UPI00188233AD|nr:ShlB/FhaC/HecB family hemolysin secretion/activation protein [Nodosilinea sp. LEGE 07088]MBE9139132.1 ShlB/FhaC/HecB family hemolysin secretion/activation protein [Nodosilinea sp. LEGE 07088]